MYIVYIDESGTQAEARYFVVAGLSCFERSTYFLAQNLDQIQARYFPGHNEPIQFHAWMLRAPEQRVPEPFTQLTREQRRSLADDVYDLISESKARIFAIAMEKSILEGEPYSRGFEEIVNRFDRMLTRIFRERGEPQRGLMVLSDSSYRENLRTLAQQIWSQGHRWGEVHNMADVPYFAPARASRLLQLADFVSNAVYGRFEHGYARDFDKIAHLIDRESNRLHGLVHIARDRRICQCPACISYRLSKVVVVEQSTTVIEAEIEDQDNGIETP